MPKRNLAWILVIVMISLLMWQLPQTIAGRDSVYKAFGPLVEARSQIRRRFVAEIDDDALIQTAVDAGIRAMVRTLHDPHAAYLDPRQYNLFKDRTEGSFGGIGVDVWPTDEGIEVLSRAPGSPAAQAGILPGEIITHVDGIPTAGRSMLEIVNAMLSGPSDSEIRVTVLNPLADGAVRELVLHRARIDIDPVRGWSRDPAGTYRFMLDPSRGIGYIRLVKFTHDVDERMDAEVTRLLGSGLHGLVLDLRENTGGVLDSALEVADRFLESGLIVRTRNRRGVVKEWYAMRDGTYPTMEIIVLVNGASASAAEIVAGALRDHRRAVVLGERTYGKGSVQEVVELDEGGALKLTTAYYYLPSGRCIHKTPEAVEQGEWGVVPDVLINLTSRQRTTWFAAWREVGREYVQTADASDATMPTQPSDATAISSEGVYTAARDLLDADVQLNRAVELLRQRLSGTQADIPESAPVSRMN